MNKCLDLFHLHPFTVPFEQKQPPGLSLKQSGPNRCLVLIGRSQGPPCFYLALVSPIGISLSMPHLANLIIPFSGASKMAA
jgi:hypothetical protein